MEIYRQMISRMNAGDELMIRDLSVLADTPQGVIATLEDIVDRGIILHIGDVGVIDDTPAGKQLLNAIASVLG